MQNVPSNTLKDAIFIIIILIRMCDFQIAHIDMDYFITMTEIRLHNTNCCILSKKLLNVTLLSV